ncbi:hypothetical protein [Acinetobacter sp. BSP-28]|uniref:hypothetical protein n=1 Tax=Acinetobacter sp. BSP-28 TaxID=3344661 RepID=UPI00376FBBC0
MDIPSVDDLNNSNKPSLADLKLYELAKQRRQRLYVLAILLYGFIGSLAGIYFSLGQAQFKGIFTLHEDVLFALNMSFNIFVYAIPAFIAAFIGSITRLLLASNDHILDHMRILLGSGLIGILTFLGLKSGIILDLIANHVEVTESLIDEHKEKLFYKYMVVCFITGMFATTMFLTIEARVNSLANNIKHT